MSPLSSVEILVSLHSLLPRFVCLGLLFAGTFPRIVKGAEDGGGGCLNLSVQSR